MMILLSALVQPAQAQDLSGLIDLLVDTGPGRTWTEVTLPNTVCGNGTQYRFYAHDNPNSNDLLFYFEGGGACWTYDGCTGLSGVLGAANPNGIPTNYMTGLQQEYASPLVNGADPGLPGRSRTNLFTQDFDVVFLPYCTGDVHVGNSTVTYTDPNSNTQITYHHNGYNNTQAVINWVDTTLSPTVGDLVVSGYSAGGTGTSANYYFIREGLNVTGDAFLINDSGPLYPAPDSTYDSRDLHDTITAQWNLNTVFNNLPSAFDPNDYGTINSALLTEYPNDQIAYTAFSMDYNYSRFSYERFTNNPTQQVILDKWQDDQDNLINLLSQYPNASWHVPWERPIIDSHTTTTVTFIGSHACEDMEPKRYWWEFLEWPWGQGYKCYSEFVPMETFLDRLYAGQTSRIVEPENGYNDDDPGMQLVAALVNAAL